MSNRTNSFLKRYKTQKSQRNFLFGHKASSKTPTHRTQLTSRSPAHRDHIQKIQLKSKDSYLIKCMNHPSKKANFQEKQSLKQAYCQQCSIKFVKYNMRMIPISEESLFLRSQLEAQIQKVNYIEEQVKQLISKYFQSQRLLLKINFIKAKQTQQNISKIPYFKIKSLNQNQLESKIKDIFGSIHLRKVSLINKNNKIQQQIEKITKSYQKKYIQTKILDQFSPTLLKQNIDDSNRTKCNTVQGRLKRLSSNSGQISKYSLLK